MHEAQNGKGRVLKQNYLITRNIKGKDIIIIDDILTTKHSVADYKEEIKRCSGKVVTAISTERHSSSPIVKNQYGENIL